MLTVHLSSKFKNCLHDITLESPSSSYLMSFRKTNSFSGAATQLYEPADDGCQKHENTRVSGINENDLAQLVGPKIIKL